MFYSTGQQHPNAAGYGPGGYDNANPYGVANSMEPVYGNAVSPRGNPTMDGASFPDPEENRSRVSPGCGGCACDGGKGNGVMTFVGAGAGEYVTETSYRYVGLGAGEYSMVPPVRGWTRVAGGCALVGLVVLSVVGILLWPRTTTTTMRFSMSPVSNAGECLFWGDPHILTFDGARPSFYGAGEFWIVKSAPVKIQGRYLGTKYTHGLSATNKVIVGGDFLQGHTIEVGTVENGTISVDGSQICPTLGCHFNLFGIGTIRYDSVGELVDTAQSNYTRRIVHMELPQDVSMDVFRWENYLDLKINMPPIPGLDGSCGNFNGNTMDDTTEAIFGRVGARVPPGESLFNHQVTVPVTEEMAEMLRRTCGPKNLQAAETACRSALAVELQTTDLMNSCLFDECFGMNEHAQRTARTFAEEEVEEEVEEELHE